LNSDLSMRKIYLVFIFFVFSCADPSEIDGTNIICLNEELYPVGLRIDSENENLSWINFGYGVSYWRGYHNFNDYWQREYFLLSDRVEWSLKEIAIVEKSSERYGLSSGRERVWEWIFVIDRETLKSELTVRHKPYAGYEKYNHKFKYFCNIIERDVMDDEVTKLRTARQKSIDESKEKKEKERLEKEKARLELIKSEKDKNII